MHVGPIAHRMRAADVRECAAFGRSPKAALRLSLRTSLYAFTALKDGRPVAMLGVCATNLIDGKGVPWLLGTDEVYSCGRDLVELGGRMLRWWLETFERLENQVSADNVRAIALLRKWGASIEEHPIVSIRGVDFVTFRLGRH